MPEPQSREPQSREPQSREPQSRELRSRDVFELRLLGFLEARCARATLRPASRKERGLLALLALRAGEYVPSAVLVEELWGDHPPATVATTLQGLVSRLRRGLGSCGVAAGVSNRRGIGYRLEVDAEQVDALRFEGLVKTGRRAAARGDVDSAARHLSEALGLWRGAPLPELAEFPFAQAEAARLEELRLEATEELVEARLALGQPTEALALVQPLVAESPYRERPSGQLMLALYRLGRQAEALRAFQQLRHTLAEGLGIEPSPALRHLERLVLTQSPELDGPVAAARPTGGVDVAPLPAPGSPEGLPGRAPGPRQHNLPRRLGPFGGRRRELAEVARLVESQRLVTLTGIGGVGKTRLAVEVASRLLPVFPGGVFLTELATLNDADLIGEAVLASLGIRPTGLAFPVGGTGEELCRHLAGRHVLLLLDGCERLVEAIARTVDDLLERCPDIVVLATSREPLGVPDETVWPVPPLTLPPEGAADPGALVGSDAVDLFCHRAQAADREFRLTRDNAAAVGQICLRLDGIPLALELAAARLRVLDVAQVAERLDERFRLLAGGGVRSAVDRHRTLRATMDWSHQLLTPLERMGLRRLSVFPAGFELTAAETVLEEPPTLPRGEVLGLLGSLADKSLLVARTWGREKRYQLLETVREYGHERLVEAGESELARDRHAAAFLDLARRHRQADPRADSGQWLRRFDVEHENLRAALERLLATGAVEQCMEIAGALQTYWVFAGHFAEACQWYERVLDRPGEEATPARVAALNGFGLVLFQRGERRRAHRLHEEAVEAAEGLGDALGAAVARLHLGNQAFQDGRLEEAEALFLEARRSSVEGAWPATAAWCDFALGRLALERGDLDGAARTCALALGASRRHGSDDLTAHVLATLAPLAALRHEGRRSELLAAEAVAVARALGCDEIRAMALIQAGEVALVLRRIDDAESALRESLALLRAMGGRRWVADCLERLAIVAERQGRGAEAALLLGACAGLREALGEGAGGGRWGSLEAARTTARIEGALGGARLAEGLARGRDMPLDEVLELALGRPVA